LVIVRQKLVAPEDDPWRLKHVVLDIIIKKIVALTVKCIHGNHVTKLSASIKAFNIQEDEVQVSKRVNYTRKD
jgi:hypothetical protein